MRTFDPTLYTADDVKPPKPGAKALAEAVLEMARADAALAAAKDVVPDPDFYATEQKNWNLAADRLHDLVHARP